MTTATRSYTPRQRMLAATLLSIMLQAETLQMIVARTLTGFDEEEFEDLLNDAEMAMLDLMCAPRDLSLIAGAVRSNLPAELLPE
jgi:hypothetical protein